LLDWTFDNEGVPTFTPIDPEIHSTTITDSETGHDMRINAIPGTRSHKTLGIMETPSGQNTDEFNRLEARAKDCARKITTASITNYKASILYFTMFLPAITYAFTVGTQSLQQLDTIQRPVTHAVLPKLGYNRHFPLEVAYGPKEDIYLLSNE
jgi:hypothetical protein